MKMNITNTLTIIILFVTINFFGQYNSGALRIRVYEKSKEGDRLVISQTMTVVINDSISLTTTTDSEDNIPKINNILQGKYKVKFIRTDCQSHEVNGIVIYDNKTSYLTLTLTCTSYINSLTKKEKKKLGYN